MDEREKAAADEAIGALCRGLPRDEPPPSVDGAILAAARQSVAARSARYWYVPVSLAAVVVLSVAVTLRVAEERPGAESVPVAPAPVERIGPEPAIAAKAADSPAAAPATTPKAREKSVSPPHRLPAARQEPAATQESRADAGTPPAFVPSPPPAAPSMAAGESAGAVAERSAAQADRRAPMMARRSAQDSSIAASAAQTPEAWLDRIVQMRSQGRHKEADESYAEFRRRFPEYTISPEMLQKITGPR